jgi:hypothetical protein
MKRSELKLTKFRLINSVDVELYFSIMVTDFENDGIKGSMLQFIDVSV